MALNRSSQNRFSSTIWPGYVDAMATLLMVLIFALTIFMVVQSVLRERIIDQDDTILRNERRIDALAQQVTALGSALGTSEDRADALAAQAEAAETEARERAARITRLGQQLAASETDLDAARSRLTDFEAEVASLLAARVADQATAEGLRADIAAQQQRASAAELAIASARSEIDAQAEAARLAAARTAALDALIADLRRRNAGADAERATVQTQLDEAEAARLTEAEAARLLRERLQASDTELTAMTLALQESRQQAEDTLVLLAAAEAARDKLGDDATASATEAERQAALLALARSELAEQEGMTDEGQRRVALLNEQVASLTAQLGALQALLDVAGDDQRQAELRVEDLGAQLNAALVVAAQEKDRRLSLEEQARLTAEEEARDLARYRSEFFGRLSQILSGREGVQVVGDRFVFDSEVLFATGEATLSNAGRAQIDNVTAMLADIATEIPAEIDWIIRVDGHTDNLPLSGTGRWRDNWELSQARALAVVRHMTADLGFPANRLAATGFADTRPIDAANSPEARAKNRRIELKLTER